MTIEKIELLREEVANLRSAASHLEYSLSRCQNLVNQADWGVWSCLPAGLSPNSPAILMGWRNDTSRSSNHAQ